MSDLQIIKSFIIFIVHFGGSMQNTYTAIIKEDGDWCIGWIEEISGVNCQEKTKEALLETLKVTLVEALQFNREEAIRAAESNYTEELY